MLYVPDDHIGMELEFIYYLTQRIIELFEKGGRREASRLFETRNDFLSKHMALWIPLFVDNIYLKLNTGRILQRHVRLTLSSLDLGYTLPSL